MRFPPDGEWPGSSAQRAVGVASSSCVVGLLSAFFREIYKMGYIVTTRGGHGAIRNGVCVVQSPYDLQVNAVVKGPGHTAFKWKL